jgi:hypothetical protein
MVFGMFVMVVSMKGREVEKGEGSRFYLYGDRSVRVSLACRTRQTCHRMVLPLACKSAMQVYNWRIVHLEDWD